jgi:hypothetical protein
VRASLREWLAASARAIGDDPALCTYAVILSFLHALTGIAWLTYKNVTALVSTDDAVCWPLIPGCYHLRAYLSPSRAGAAVAIYIALGIAAGALFAARKTRPALLTFVLAALVGTAIYSLDYRLRFNQTYMFGWVVLAFLLAPRKGIAIQALVALFYFWAGTLKINREWTSGAALYAKPFLVPEAWIPASCVYVLVLELVLVWGLFAPRPRWRWGVYAQLVLFHLVSWRVVGFFYPLLMIGLTAIYPLVWRRSPEATLTFARLGSDPCARITVLAVAATFSLFQLAPHLFPGDTAITGEGRLFALHMFDARAHCEGGAVLTAASGERSRAPLIDDAADARSRCDPITLAATAARLCRLLAARGDARRVDVKIDARRATDVELQPLIHVDDFCHRAIEYSVWHHNDWIGAR